MNTFVNQAALNIPMFARSGRQIIEILSFNKYTKRVHCAIEGGGEQTYDFADLLHHFGDQGKKVHFAAAGYAL